MATKLFRTNQVCSNIRDAGGLHGSGIEGAQIGKGEVLVMQVDTPESPHDGWGLIVGPNPPINPDGTYLRYGKKAWVEMAHLVEIGANIERINLTLEINWNEHTYRLV